MTQEQIRQLFKTRGLKLTPQRRAIYEKLAACTDHPTAEEIYRHVKRAYPMISPNTVYYTLTAFKKAGLISEVNLGHQHARFDANMTRHHHLICVSCEAIKDLYDPYLDRLTVSRGKGHQYTILRHRVEFYGYCRECRHKAET